MSVRFWTSNPRSLLHHFEEGIRSGEIATWSYGADGLFGHVSQHLRGKAFVRPKIYRDSLAFAILDSKGVEMTVQLFGMYQACLMQTFLTHLSERFTLADASSDFRARDGDLGVFGFQEPEWLTPTPGRPAHGQNLNSTTPFS